MGVIPAEFRTAGFARSVAKRKQSDIDSGLLLANKHVKTGGRQARLTCEAKFAEVRAPFEVRKFPKVWLCCGYGC